MNQDLTIGKPARVLWRFCLPLFGSIIFQQIYNIADSLVAGRYLGENALAAVGNSYELTLIFTAFAFGCNIGCSVILSQLFGSRDYGNMKTAVRTAMISSALLCLTLMAVSLCGSTLLLRAIRTPDIIFDDSRLYLNIYILGLPFVFFYNLATGIFSALGDSRTPFCFLAASSTANVGMDILFVSGFHMGVDGVAWATFLCQGVSCVLAVSFVFRRLSGISSDGKGTFFSFPLFKKMAAIAIPSILQQSFISVGNILIQGIINGFGAGVIAGYSAAIKLNNLVITAFSTMGNGISNYSAQNLGAQKTGRIREGLRASLKMVWLLCVPLTALYLLCGRSLILFFLSDPSDDAMRTGIWILRILSPFYFVVSSKMAADGILRGCRLMKPFMISTFTDLILRVVLAFFFSRTALGSTGIWCAWPVGWSIATVISMYFYRHYARRSFL